MQERGRETRIRILRESRRLFTVNGFRNTSVSEIIQATGVKKGNLYYHFAGKDDLGLAVLRDARDEFFAILDQSLGGDDPRRRVIRSCRVIVERMREENFVGGCLFGNAALEMSDIDARFDAVIKEVFSGWIDRLNREIRLAASGGAVFGLPEESLAGIIVSLLEGAIMQARVYKSPRSLRDAIRAVAYLLGVDESDG